MAGQMKPSAGGFNIGNKLPQNSTLPVPFGLVATHPRQYLRECRFSPGDHNANLVDLAHEF